MATNYGMLNNIASGVKEAMTAYQTNKTLQRQEQMQNLLQGAQENPDTGQLEYTPEMKMRKDAELKGLLAKQNESIADSEESKSARALAKANGLLVPDTMTAAQLKEYSPILTAKMKDEYLLKSLANRGGNLNINADIKRDAQSAKAVNDIHNDKMLTGMMGQAQNIDKGMNLITGDKAPSVTTMHEIAQDFAQALSGKGVASDFKLKSISTPTLQENLAKLNQYMTSNPNQPAPPEVVAFWKDMGERLRGAYDRQMGARANSKVSEIETIYSHNPNAVKAAKSAADLYRTGKWRESGLEQDGEEVNSVGKGLIQQSTGQTVKVFDPKGNVRIIPKDQLDAAIKAGGKLAE